MLPLCIWEHQDDWDCSLNSLAFLISLLTHRHRHTHRNKITFKACWLGPFIQAGFPLILRSSRKIGNKCSCQLSSFRQCSQFICYLWHLKKKKKKYRMYRSFANEKYFCSSLQLLKSWNEILEFQVPTPSQLTPTLTSKYKKSYL